jgi:hypothetical protein
MGLACGKLLDADSYLTHPARLGRTGAAVNERDGENSGEAKSEGRTCP